MSSSNNKLSQYFPVIRAREDISNEIENNEKLKTVFNSWSEEHREEFLEICTGNKGVKMLYDTYFKELLNPETVPERLSALLSVILKRKVTVKYVLPNDGTRLGDEMSLIITDIVVELEDHSIANIEVQKIGYAFTGERASCYSADLLLRQYKRVKDKLKEKFTYKNIGSVYTIVFLERSPAVFKEYPEKYVHYFKSTSDTGLELGMLQNIIFIPVDIFLEKLHNKGIQDELDAWLTFLGCDEPEYIVELINKYPIFKGMYADLYNMCLNVEGVMNMFSKELQILDQNTVKYMIDEMQEELDNIKDELDTAKSELDTTKTELDTTKTELDTTKSELDTAKTELDTANTTISNQSKEIADKEKLIAKLQAELKKHQK
ncbi:MAG: hypothetical protein E7309_03590 [Butyrivibrio sp.]|nr:hypothetical protein [Butyrivibrio sp.]